MQTVIETITPAKAVEYRNSSLGNRPLSKTTVKSYADTMKQGKWMLNGVPIIFDDEGHIIDGHHRIEAIISAGIPVQMTVCRGVPATAFVTIDQGRSKSLGQLLAMQQVDNYNIVASTVNGNKSLVLNGRLWTNNSAKTKGMNNADFYDEYQRNPEEYQEAASFAGEMYRQARILKASWVGSLYYYLSHTGGYKKDFVKKFFTATCGLETSGINAADQLRNYIIRSERTNPNKGNQKSNLNMKHEFLFAIVCKAWNAYASGKEVQRYNFNPEKESYPRLKLNIEE